MRSPCGSRSRFAVYAVSIGAVFLGACGGGGGSNGGNNGGSGNNPPPVDPGLPYTGLTTAATLSADSTPTIAGALLFELGLASGDRPVPVQFGGRKVGLPKVSRVLGKVRAQTGWLSKPVSTEDCSGGGTIRIDDQRTASGTGTVILTHTACVEDGVRTDGVLRLQINAYDFTNDQPTDLMATFEGYTQTEGSLAMDLDGTVHSVTTSTATTTTYDSLTRYRPEGVQHRMQNLVLQELPIGANSLGVTITGRFFQSTYGYVDVDTREPLVVDRFVFLARAGVLRLHNSGAAVADLRFPAPDQLVLSLDQDGDGSADRQLSASGLAGLRRTNHLPVADAGPDATIVEGQTATLSATGADWEGDALTFEWWCDSAPTGGQFVIGAGAQAQFHPSEAGTYVLHARVSDGQPGELAFDYMFLTVTENSTPVAAAGADVVTVEKQTVMLDASGSTDVENDELHYTWTLLAQPALGAAPDSGEGQTFSFAPGVPGTYTYQLTVEDAFGASQDTVNIVADGLIGFAFSSSVVIDPTTTPDLITRTLQINTSPNYSGPPVPLTVSTDVPWLDIVSAATQTGANATVVVTIDPDELSSLEHGVGLAGTVTVTPTGFTPRSDQLQLTVMLPKIEHVAPYVGYVGQPSPVTFYGKALHTTQGATLVINGIEVQGFTEAMPEHSRITLPALPAGDYDMHIKNNLGVVLPMGRFVVRAMPTYADGEVAIPGRIEALEYDMERDVFYAVSTALPTSTTEAWRLRFDGAQWQRDTIAAPAPQSIALNADGTKLIVTSANCIVREVDPDTLQVLEFSAKPDCFMEYFGLAVGLADGRILVGDTDQWPTVYDYPAFSTSTIGFPSIHGPHYVLNRTHERLLWAETPGISPPRELFQYDLRNNSFPQIIIVDPQTWLLSWNLAISGDGHRVMHRQDVYEDGQYIGSISGLTDTLISPALTTAGDRAVVLDPLTDVVALFDLGSGPNFAKIGDVATLPDDVDGQARISLLPDDSVAFVFAIMRGPPGSGPNGFKLYVRNLP